MTIVLITHETDIAHYARRVIEPRRWISRTGGRGRGEKP
jgi:ABC-type lipoprotein export system ATPase subunit